MTTQKSTITPEDLFDFKGAVERWTDASRKATHSSLEMYEKTVDQLADAGVKTAQAFNMPAITKIAETNAALSREVAGAYATTVRELIKA